MRLDFRRSLIGMAVLILLIGACSSGGSGESNAEVTTTSGANSTSETTSSLQAEPRNVTTPQISGPITGPGGLWSAVTSVPADSSYVTEEFFLSGTATSYQVDGDLGVDGRWHAVPDDEADYETRILVHRPAAAADFNGTVVLEWLNVSAGFETAPDFLFTQRELLRSGYAWVGVSAQQAGIEPSEDDEGVLGIEPLKGMNPERYESLNHPGDRYSFDIFTQASAAVRATGEAAPLGGLEVDHVIADGESQSAFRMLDYINAIQPLTGAFDGFLVHSRWAEGTPFGPDRTPPENAVIRTDQAVPVLQVQAETDVPLYTDARQDDSEWIRTWEIAGTAHVDNNVLANAMGCTVPVNTGPQIYVMAAALDALRTWIIDSSQAPPEAPRVTLEADGAIARDEHGNAIGGIRTPQLDVPLATLSGEGGQGPDFCTIAGVTEPFGAQKLVSLYGSTEEYLTQFDASMEGAVHKGFLLEADVAAMRDAAVSAWDEPAR